MQNNISYTELRVVTKTTATTKKKKNVHLNKRQKFHTIIILAHNNITHD